MKKQLSVILGTAMVCAALSGCSGSTETQTSENPSSQVAEEGQTEETEAAGGEVVELCILR